MKGISERSRKETVFFKKKNLTITDQHPLNLRKPEYLINAKINKSIFSVWLQIIEVRTKFKLECD
jgi:hypothetical protein